MISLWTCYTLITVAVSLPNALPGVNRSSTTDVYLGHNLVRMSDLSPLTIETMEQTDDFHYPIKSWYGDHEIRTTFNWAVRDSWVYTDHMTSEELDGHKYWTIDWNKKKDKKEWSSGTSGTQLKGHLFTDDIILAIADEIATSTDPGVTTSIKSGTNQGLSFPEQAFYGVTNFRKFSVYQSTSIDRSTSFDAVLGLAFRLGDTHQLPTFLEHVTQPKGYGVIGVALRRGKTGYYHLGCEYKNTWSVSGAPSATVPILRNTEEKKNSLEKTGQDPSRASGNLGLYTFKGFSYAVIGADGHKTKVAYSHARVLVNPGEPMLILSSEAVERFLCQIDPKDLKRRGLRFLVKENAFIPDYVVIIKGIEFRMSRENLVLRNKVPDAPGYRYLAMRKSPSVVITLGVPLCHVAYLIYDMSKMNFELTLTPMRQDL